VYFGPVEIRNWLVPGQEQVITYPHPAIKLTNGIPTYLHRDHLGPNRAITDATGTEIESAIYKPFGEQTETLSPANLTPESKGWIGLRYDADARLQYLNARYYDPVLGMFLQPDWFEVLQPGVGTNRFSYSFNDPVNMSDPSGNFGERLFNWAANGLERLFKDTVRDLSQRNATASQKPWSERISTAVTYALPGAAASKLAQQSYSNGNYGQAAGHAVASLGEAALGLFPGTKLLGATATPRKVLVASRVTPNAVGRAGEAAVQAAYAIGPKVPISVSGRTRIPDGLTEEVLSEVKNVAALSYTSQLRDFAAYASQTGLDFHLYVRPSTVLTRELLAEVNSGSIVLRFIP
jgi:RHS repeat-associated protein